MLSVPLHQRARSCQVWAACAAGMASGVSPHAHCATSRRYISGGLHCDANCAWSTWPIPLTTPAAYASAPSIRCRNGSTCLISIRLNTFCRAAPTLYPIRAWFSFGYRDRVASPTVRHCPTASADAALALASRIRSWKPVASIVESTPFVCARHGSAGRGAHRT